MNVILIEFRLKSEVATSINFHIVYRSVIWFILTSCSSSIRGCSRSSLRHQFAHGSNLLFVIHSITGPDLLSIIDSFAVADLLFTMASLTVADVRFLIKHSQDEKRERRAV
jgi:hypothetical protein